MTDPTKPLSVFEVFGKPCGLSEAHPSHEKGMPWSLHPYTPPAEPAAPVSPPAPKFSFLDSGEISDMPSEVAPVSPEPPRDVVNYEQRIHTRTGEMTLHSEAGTVGATPETESKADQQWLHLVAKLNTIHAQLQHKPSHLKCGHRQEIGSILNAYREGDLSFDEAKLAAQSLPSPAPQEVPSPCPTCGSDTRCIHGLLFSERCEPCEAPDPDSADAAASPAHPVGTLGAIARQIEEYLYRNWTGEIDDPYEARMEKVAALISAQPVGSADKEQQ